MPANTVKCGTSLLAVHPYSVGLVTYRAIQLRPGIVSRPCSAVSPGKFKARLHFKLCPTETGRAAGWSIFPTTNGCRQSYRQLACIRTLDSHSFTHCSISNTKSHPYGPILDHGFERYGATSLASLCIACFSPPMLTVSSYDPFSLMICSNQD